MATKQTDTVAMTDEQLDGVSGGPHYKDFGGRFQLVGGAALGDIKGEHVQGGVLRINQVGSRMRFRGCVPTDPD